MIPTAPVPFWEYSDLINMAIFIPLIGMLVFMQYKKTGALAGTISQSVAHSSRSSTVFSVALTILFPLYYAFMWLWVGPLTNMPAWFYYILAFSAICELILVWVPDRPGKASLVHRVAAGIVGAVVITIPIAILLCGKNLSTIASIGIGGFILLSALLGIILLFKSLRKYTFVLEATYFMAFLMVMSIVAHS